MSCVRPTHQRWWLLALSTAIVTACSPAGESATAPELSPLMAKGGGSTGGGSTAAVAAVGDIAFGPLSSGVSSAPFKNLTLKNVSITLGSTLTGIIADCQRDPSRVFTNAWKEWEGQWTGELLIWQGSRTTASNLRFFGTRPGTRAGQALDTLQFTSNDSNALQTVSGKVTTLAMADAPLGVGGASSYFDADDRDVNGLPLLRCANVTFTSTLP